MFDQEARLERLLIRHPDAAVVEPLTGRPALIRRDQVLVAAHDVPAVEGLVRRWEESRHDEAGVCRLRLRRSARVDVCELTHQLSSDGRHRRLAVAPNTLMYGQPLWWSGPADRPRPVAPVPAPEAAAPGLRKVTVAVLDTGLSPHPWFEATDWYAGQREEAAEVLDADLDFELDAQAGHGTFVTGVLLGQAPAVAVRALRVIGGDGVGDEFDVIRALAMLAAPHRHGRRERADIVNMSLGCYTYDDRPSPVLARSVAALGRRTVVVACAGNAASDRPFWPAALKHVIAVAARSGTDRAWFSNYGWWVDACAPGVDITSSFVCYDGPYSFQGYATWSGTSFAAPTVAGLIAERAAAEDLPPVIAADRILDPTAAPTVPDLGVLLPVPG